DLQGDLGLLVLEPPFVAVHGAHAGDAGAAGHDLLQVEVQLVLAVRLALLQVLLQPPLLLLLLRHLADGLRKHLLRGLLGALADLEQGLEAVGWHPPSSYRGPAHSANRPIRRWTISSYSMASSVGCLRKSMIASYLSMA